MTLKCKKTYIRLIFICAIIIALVFCIKTVLTRYADQASSLDGLYAAEKYDGKYYDKENDLYLIFSEKDESFLITDHSMTYRVLFRRGGLGGYLFVIFSDESGEYETFYGSAKIDKDGTLIEIECDSPKYEKFVFKRK